MCIIYPDLTPKCLFHYVSGYDCPACGMQRAFRHVVYGEFRAAFWCNPYLALMSPYILLLFVAETGGDRTARLRKGLTDYKTVIFLGLLMLGWWIFRNTMLWHNFSGTMYPN